MVVGASAQSASIVLLALVVFVVGRRAVGMARGTTLSLPRLFGFTALYAFIFAVLALEELVQFPVAVVAVNVAIVGAVAVLSYPFVRRRVVVYTDPNGGWSYRVGYVVPLVYLVLFVVRLAIDLAVLGQIPFTFAPVAPQLSPASLAVVLSVDALFAGSTGLLLARTAAVYRAYRDVRSASAPPAAAA